MSITERESIAAAYSRRCQRRRNRAARRRQRNMERFIRFAWPFAGGVCAVAFLLTLMI